MIHHFCSQVEFYLVLSMNFQIINPGWSYLVRGSGSDQDRIIFEISDQDQNMFWIFFSCDPIWSKNLQLPLKNVHFQFKIWPFIQTIMGKKSLGKYIHYFELLKTYSLKNFSGRGRNKLIGVENILLSKERVFNIAGRIRHAIEITKIDLLMNDKRWYTSSLHHINSDFERNSIFWLIFLKFVGCVIGEQTNSFNFLKYAIFDHEK